MKESNNSIYQFNRKYLVRNRYVQQMTHCDCKQFDIISFFIIISIINQVIKDLFYQRQLR